MHGPCCGQASKECPAGTMAWAWKAYRGFVSRGDKDNYEFELNCKRAGDAQQATRPPTQP